MDLNNVQPARMNIIFKMSDIISQFNTASSESLFIILPARIPILTHGIYVQKYFHLQGGYMRMGLISAIYTSQKQ